MQWKDWIWEKHGVATVYDPDIGEELRSGRFKASSTHCVTTCDNSSTEAGVFTNLYGSFIE